MLRQWYWPWSSKQITLLGIPVLGMRTETEWMEETKVSSASGVKTSRKDWLFGTVCGSILLGFATDFTTNWIFAKFQAFSAQIKTATLKVTTPDCMADILGLIHAVLTFLLP